MNGLNEFATLLIVIFLALFIGLLFVAFAFVITSLAPQGKFRILPLSGLFILLEIDWICIWAAELFFLGGRLDSKAVVAASLGTLFFFMALPVFWLIYARVGISRKTLRPLVFSLKQIKNP